MSKNEIILSAKNISKAYNNKNILSISGFSFKRGKIYGIIGPSGAGKSTFLRILAFMEESFNGEIFFNDQIIPRKGVAKFLIQRQMTMVTEKPLLFALSVKENIAYSLKARRFKKEEIQKKASSLLEKIGMLKFANRRADTLSAGERQRVALARAIAFGPCLLFLDEPTANLDPFSVERIEELIEELNSETGMTVIMSSHNLSQVKRIVQEVIFLWEGQIVEKGKAENFFSNPRDPRAKAFIGLF